MCVFSLITSSRISWKRLKFGTDFPTLLGALFFAPSPIVFLFASKFAGDRIMLRGRLLKLVLSGVTFLPQFLMFDSFKALLCPVHRIGFNLKLALRGPSKSSVAFSAKLQESAADELLGLNNSALLAEFREDLRLRTYGIILISLPPRIQTHSSSFVSKMLWGKEVVDLLSFQHYSPLSQRSPFSFAKVVALIALSSFLICVKHSLPRCTSFVEADAKRSTGRDPSSFFQCSPYPLIVVAMNNLSFLFGCLTHVTCNSKLALPQRETLT